MKTLLSFLILCSSVAFAQNYNCLQPGAKNYFINGDGYVRGMRIDSTGMSGTDTIYYPYRTPRGLSYAIFSPISDSLGASWLGKKVLKNTDGTFLFDNLWDTVIIKTQAHVGDSWIFFNDTTMFYYTATIVSEDTMAISGILDSIKKIMITAYSAGTINIADPVNNFQLTLSKNNGFVQIFDLYTFPYRRPNTSTFSPEFFAADYYLDVLLNNLDHGDGWNNYPPSQENSIFHLFTFHNPTQMEIYDFAIGDVYESHYNKTINSPYSYDEYTVDSITNKTSATGLVFYTGSTVSSTVTVDYSIIPSLVKEIYSRVPYALTADSTLLIDSLTMPEEWNAMHLLHYFPRYNVGCDSATSYQVDIDYKGTGFSNYGNSGIVPSYDYTIYSIGYGITNRSAYAALYKQAETLSCPYYDKNGVACEKFYIPNKINVLNASSNNIVRITPNPANDHIDITSTTLFTANTLISVYDMAGRLILRSPAEQQNRLTINTSTWNDGLYLVIIQNNDGIVAKQKVVVSH